LLNRFRCDPKLAQALSWGLALKREVETAMVVFVLPLAELLGELGRGPEDHAPVELVFVGPMAALDLSINLGAAPRNLPMDHPEIPQVPGEVGPKLRAMVRLDALDGHRQAAAHFLDELSGRFDGVVSIDPKHAIPGGLIDGGELVEAAAAEFEVLDIDLDRLPRDVDLSPASGTWAIAFQGHPGDALPLQNPLDGRRGDIDLMVALQEEADPKGPVLTLPADLQDQGDDVGWRREGVVARPSRTVAKANQAVLAVPVTPDIEETP
jgi:hypothetical protein